MPPICRPAPCDAEFKLADPTRPVIISPGSASLTSGQFFSYTIVAPSTADRANFTLGAAQLGSGAQTLEVVSEVTHLGRDATSRQVVSFGA